MPRSPRGERRAMNAISKCGLAVAATLLVTVQAAAEGIKVGVFNAQAVSESTEIGKKIQTQLTTFSEEKEGQITERQKKLADLRQQLNQQSLSLSGDKRAELEKDIQRHVLALQSFQETARSELELEYTSATRGFQEKLLAVISEFGKNEGFTVILDQSQVAWFDASIDLTSALIDRFNR